MKDPFRLALPLGEFSDVTMSSAQAAMLAVSAATVVHVTMSSAQAAMRAVSTATAHMPRKPFTCSAADPVSDTASKRFRPRKKKHTHFSPRSHRSEKSSWRVSRFGPLGKTKRSKHTT